MRTDEFTKGTWLVVVEDGCTSVKRIDPDFPELDAALHYVHDTMTKAMSRKAKMRPKSIRMSDKEIEAWKAYEKVMGADDIPRYFEFASLSEIADAGCKVIKKRAKSEKKKYRANPKEKINSILDLEV